MCIHGPGSDSLVSSAVECAVPVLVSEESLCKLAALAPLLTSPCSGPPAHPPANTCAFTWVPYTLDVVPDGTAAMTAMHASHVITQVILTTTIKIKQCH